MRVALKTPAPYIGIIGSLAKWRTIREHLTTDGYGDTDLSRVFAPIGLDLGGPTPQEIAVAILAEVVAVLHQRLKENSIPLRRLSVK